MTIDDENCLHLDVGVCSDVSSLLALVLEEHQPLATFDIDIGCSLPW
jgi:hypothetical protein